MSTSIKIEKEIKDRFVELFVKKHGTKPSVAGKVETLLMEEIKKLEEELNK